MGQSAQGRDVRIDIVRGIALMMIFVDHVSGNLLAKVTLQSIGWTDAAEIFVFLAGMSAVLAFMPHFERGEIPAALLRIARRVRDIYVAHILLFVAVIVVCAFAARQLGDPSYMEDFALDALFIDPALAIIRMATLTYQPYFLDVLPLYVVLLMALPLLLAGLKIHWALPLAVSIALYVGVLATGLNLPNYPAARVWFFNPFAWQLVFVLGATTAQLWRLGKFSKVSGAGWASMVTAAAIAVVLFAFLASAPWRSIPALANVVAIPPNALPLIDKSLLSPLRILDLLAKVWLFARLIPSTAPYLMSRPARALGQCGRYSLEVFCSGVILSILATIALRETGYAWSLQVLVNVAGFAILLVVAKTAAWLSGFGSRGERTQTAPVVRAQPTVSAHQRLPDVEVNRS